MVQRAARSLPLGLLVACWLGVSAPMAAVDGVVEINQTSAAAGNVTPGDAPGLPVTITRSGSYRLTSNLSTGSRAVTAILVDADDVTLDLNGFTVACTFSSVIIPPNCQSLAGNGSAIEAATGVARTRVRNGTVRGMGGDGLDLGDGSVVSHLVAIANGGAGIHVGVESRVTDSTALDSGSDGIVTGFGSRVVGCVVRDSGARGIVASGSVIESNLVSDSGTTGIQGQGAAVSGNVVSNSDGIGIDAISQATVIGNRITNSGGSALQLGSGSGYVHNVVSGGAIAGGDAMGVNICDGSPCP